MYDLRIMWQSYTLCERGELPDKPNDFHWLELDIYCPSSVCGTVSIARFNFLSLLVLFLVV